MTPPLKNFHPPMPTDPKWLESLKAMVTNRLDPDRLQGKVLTAILGDLPSTYAKSPRLWNAAFEALNLPCLYLPLDISRQKLPQLIQLLRSSESFLGGNVTIPYKGDVLSLLDEVDPLSSRIGAVNTIVRTPEGQLLGSNTDGMGGVSALIQKLDPKVSPLCSSLQGKKILLMGCGGSGAALAFSFLKAIGASGELFIANRHRNRAEELAGRLSLAHPGRVEAVSEEAIAEVARRVDLIVNATTKGQAGWRRADAGWTCLEPYSALAKANPAIVSTEIGEAERREVWWERSGEDIRRNQEMSLKVLKSVPAHVICYDIVYAPPETVFLKQARETGHPTLNGKGMNILQAVESFFRYTCHSLLQARGLATEETYQKILQMMVSVW